MSARDPEIGWPVRIELGIGGYQIGVSPAKTPPQVHFYASRHNKPIGSDVPHEDRIGEPVLTLVFHNRDAVIAMRRALENAAGWFPLEVIDARYVL